MKPETKIKKQIENVEKWLKKSREFLTDGYLSDKDHGAFYLLIATEQLLELLKLFDLQPKYGNPKQ